MFLPTLMIPSLYCICMCSQRLAEIAFCVIIADDRIKGYGARLMNHLKQHVRDMDGVTHLLTCADYSVVDSFTKQVC